MFLSNYIARKIYSAGDSKRVSRPAIIVATAGTAIGLAVMIISVCVVLGFKHTIRDKVIGFGGHLTVTNAQSKQSMEAGPICTSDSVYQVLQKAPHVAHIQEYALKQGVLKTDSDFLGVVFKGVDEKWDNKFIAENIVEGKLPVFSKSKTDNDLVISKNMADKLQLKIGDKVFAYFVADEDVRARKFKVAAIYDTNMSKFDEIFCFTDIYTTRHLNDWENDEATGYEISIDDFDKLDETADYLISNINKRTDKYGDTYTSSTIKENNGQIFSWLQLLDLNIWIILALMVCVAAVTMTSGLLIIILERVSMIGILKALGARNSMIRHTFVWFAAFIIIRGVIIGDIIGLGICLLQKYTGFVTLDPQTYYVSAAPVELNVPFIVLINVATIIICTLVMIAPSFLISHIQPAKSIRFGE